MIQTLYKHKPIFLNKYKLELKLKHNDMVMCVNDFVCSLKKH